MTRTILGIINDVKRLQLGWAYRKTFRLPQENGDITDIVRKQISNDHF
jgi:hypothetical protein